MRLAILRCGGCDSVERKLYLHHGRLLCALCLTYDDRDDMAVKVKIVVLHSEAVRAESRRVRGK